MSAPSQCNGRKAFMKRVSRDDSNEDSARDESLEENAKAETCVCSDLFFNCDSDESFAGERQEEHKVAAPSCFELCCNYNDSDESAVYNVMRKQEFIRRSASCADLFYNYDSGDSASPRQHEMTPAPNNRADEELPSGSGQAERDAASFDDRRVENCTSPLLESCDCVNLSPTGFSSQTIDGSWRTLTDTETRPFDCSLCVFVANSVGNLRERFRIYRDDRFGAFSRNERRASSATTISVRSQPVYRDDGQHEGAAASGCLSGLCHHIINQIASLTQLGGRIHSYFRWLYLILSGKMILELFDAAFAVVARFL